MSLRIGAALQSGGSRLVSRTGTLLTVSYLVLYAVYQTGFNVLMNALYARIGLPAAIPAPIGLPLPVAAAVVAAALLVLTWVSLVAIRTFVAGERDAIPRGFWTDGVGWALPNLVVGGLLTSVLVTVGFVFLILPGLFLLVGLAFMAMYIAVEGDDFVTAMRRSWGLARGNRLSILGLVVVVAALGAAAGVGFGLASLVLALAGLEPLTPLLTAVLVAPMTMYNVAAVSAAFEQLRGTDRPEL
ncbi:hypothetical protein EI982_14280 [Haloplanus rallus]|uniref:DUF7847 domain-containing protein n=1 Tax=Haloplanus rallus TaxID=1816183 RepID=A0A6B9F5R6_9EURY|nr:hypothetical protein [Haloplanus rallus]QGX95865.1 hypothetical protein EI982_14280 [Haloplanus rallus]